jgi:hypothetical protein
MTASALGRVQQVFLLCALALGIVGMHHLTTTDDTMGAAAPTVVATMMPPAPHDMPGAVEDVASLPIEQHPTAPMPSHDLMHLCLAVMCAVGFALAALWLLLRILRRGDQSNAPITSGPPRAPDRPPDRRGRLLLASLCILRV